MIVSSQFGATCDQTDYETDVHTLALSADYEASEKLNLFADASFSDAKADWKNLFIATPAVVDDPVLLELYDFEGLSAITGFSDLHYQQTEVNLGGTYRFTPALYLTAQAGWQLFDDKTPYVYGDQDGTAYSGRVGVGYRF